MTFSLRKEVIQPQVLLRLPCYDFTPVTSPTFDSCLLADSSPASGVTGSHGVTGLVHTARHIMKAVCTRSHRANRKEAGAEGMDGDWDEVVTR